MKQDDYYLELEKQEYYKNIDKRSKDYREYKEWKATKKSSDYNKLKENIDNKSKGVGDTIAKITKATGVDKLVKFIAGEDCGCSERQEKLNELFNYKNVNCISEEDYNYVKDYFALKTSKVTNEQKIRLITIHNTLFNKRQKTNTSCTPCIVGVVNKIKKYLEVYN